MPAVQLARLKIQAAGLGAKFSQPPAFVLELRSLLESYADHSHRPGQSGSPSPLLQSYHVPPPVLRQILLEITPQVTASPEQALAVCDALWQQANLECRSLAISIIGLLRVEAAGPVLQRARNWMHSETEEHLIVAMLERGLRRIRQEATVSYASEVRAWLHSTDFHDQQIGLRALYYLVEDPSFDNLPLAFRLLAPWVRIAPTRLRPFIVRNLRLLVQRTPKETGYFLRTNLATPESPDTAWATRQVLADFPEDLQAGLREALKAAGNKTWFGN
ncbi:MAG: DNA alkylation repair protein [Omnitrophica WOR_2 bacterium]